MNEAPATPADWNVPVLVYCTHKSQIIAFESMFPFHFNHGDDTNFWDRSIDMVDQDVETLPTYHSVAYDPTTKITTLVVKGKSALSQSEFGEKVEFTSTKTTEPSGTASASSSSLKIISLLIASILSMIVPAVL
jgi:hypothetical protein